MNLDGRSCALHTEPLSGPAGQPLSSAQGRSGAAAAPQAEPCVAPGSSPISLSALTTLALPSGLQCGFGYVDVKMGVVGPALGRDSELLEPAGGSLS